MWSEVKEDLVGGRLVPVLCPDVLPAARIVDLSTEFVLLSDGQRLPIVGVAPRGRGALVFAGPSVSGCCYSLTLSDIGSGKAMH